MPEFENRTIKEIVSEYLPGKTFSEIDVDLFAPDGKWASQIARYLGSKMKINQLRKVFGELKRIELTLKGKKDNDAFVDHRIYLLFL